MTHPDRPDHIDLASLSPSALLLLAITDLARCELDPNYVIQMFTWHSPRSYYSNACSVCLAGAVMAQSLNTPLRERRRPADFDEHTANSLKALDWFRLGYLRYGLVVLGHKDEARLESIEDRSITPHDVDPTEFFSDMMSTHRYLLKMGY